MTGAEAHHARQVGRMAKGEAEIPVTIVLLLLYSMIHYGDRPVVPLWVWRTG